MFRITQFISEELGLVTTPPKTAEFMVSKIVENYKKGQKILDPCVGPGIFIEKLLELGIKANDIYAYDIKPTYKKDLKRLGISFERKDVLLSFTSDSKNQFDYIIGNPPYLNKSSEYVRRNKKELKPLYGKINAHETYSMFIVNSIWRLKEGGKMVFITSDTFLTLRSHRKLRKFILSNCKINELILAPKALFTSQSVSTKTIILVLTKLTREKNRQNRKENIIKIIPRLNNESEYIDPPKVKKVKQKKYHLLPFNIFCTDVEDEIIDLFEKSPKLSEFTDGYIGMHTHNNRKFIAAIEGTELAEIFKKRNEQIKKQNRKYKIISREEFKLSQWKPYLKRGGGDQYYRPIMEALDWRESSREVYDIPKNAPFEKEGIVISGVSSHLAARYMPSGCYWDSNKAIGFIIKDPEFSIEYVLGVLNSSLYNYLAKGIINNTSSIQLSALKALPMIKPDKDIKELVEFWVKKILEKKKIKINYEYIKEQRQIDKTIFDFYKQQFEFSQDLKEKLNRKYAIYSN
ncbi:MAG: Modification methylase TaqI [Promethearchaeota archaeon]|nr:MAG: Modification methylase TaqI [Candidatus Lokiarchaeota archaeon]